MITRHRSELRAGLFINLGLALIAVALFFFGNHVWFQKTAHFHFVLQNAEGLLSGTKVYVAGIDAGKINSISLEPQTNDVRIDLEISERFRNSIHRDGGIELNTQGVLGDRAVFIDPGNPREPVIREGLEIPVRETAGLKSLVSGGDKLMRDLDGLIGNLNRFATRLNHDVNLGRVDDTIGKLDSILGKLDSGQGTMGALINDPSLYDDAKALVGEANQNRILRNVVRKSIEDAEAKQKG